jgi:hypothetical protein
MSFIRNKKPTPGQESVGLTEASYREREEVTGGKRCVSCPGKESGALAAALTLKSFEKNGKKEGTILSVMRK